MKFKTDENVHPDLAARLRAEGHDAMTIWDQNLRGRSDADLASSTTASVSPDLSPSSPSAPAQRDGALEVP